MACLEESRRKTEAALAFYREAVEPLGQVTGETGEPPIGCSRPSVTAAATPYFRLRRRSMPKPPRASSESVAGSGTAPRPLISDTR